jgi:SAM-dependent methyltransferase
MAYDPGAQWAINLQEGGYENHCRDAQDLKRIKRLGSAWRRILRTTGLRPPAAAYEIGFGGAEKLATLGLNGFAIGGIEVSEAAFARARQYVREIETVGSLKLDVRLELGDFFSQHADSKFDLVFHFGVVEHYLDDQRRAEFWRRATALAKSGSWIVSVVPCGRHVMRRMMREQELCGYLTRLAEVDYSCASHAAEFHEAGLRDVRVLPHNYMFFLSGHPNRWVRRLVFPPLFVLTNVLLPWMPLPLVWKERFAHTLIAVGRVPG